MSTSRPCRDRAEELRLADDSRLRKASSSEQLRNAQGVRMYRQAGLNPPPAVQYAVAEYRKAMDVVGQWLDDCCEIAPQWFVNVAAAYESYVKWARTEAKWEFGKNRFGRIIHERFGSNDDDKEGGQRVYRGFRLRPTVLGGTKPAAAMAVSQGGELVNAGRGRFHHH